MNVGVTATQHRRETVAALQTEPVKLTSDDSKFFSSKPDNSPSRIFSLELRKIETQMEQIRDSFAIIKVLEKSNKIAKITDKENTCAVCRARAESNEANKANGKSYNDSQDDKLVQLIDQNTNLYEQTVKMKEQISVLKEQIVELKERIALLKKHKWLSMRKLSSLKDESLIMTKALQTFTTTFSELINEDGEVVTLVKEFERQV